MVHRARARILGAALAASLVLPIVPASAQALIQGMPDFKAYPLRDRVFGPGGAVTPDYVAPSETVLSFLTGTNGPKRGTIFGAASADLLCQQEQRPQITVLQAPAGVKLAVEPGTVLASSLDGGSTYCLNRPAAGTVVRAVGRVPKGGATVLLKVTYPHLGAWYIHEVQVPGR